MAMASSSSTFMQAQLRRMTSLCLLVTFAATWSATPGRAQTFFTDMGAYRPAAQQSAVLTFYMHDNLDTNPSSAVTVVPSISSVNGASNSNLFGAIAVFDDSITLSSDPGSQYLGRGRGFYVFNSMDTGTSLEFVFTAVFDQNSGYSGSTISFKGYDKIGDANREITITGGTGAFRMAQGWAVINTANANGGAATLLFTAHVFYGF